MNKLLVYSEQHQSDQYVTNKPLYFMHISIIKQQVLVSVENTNPFAKQYFSLILMDHERLARWSKPRSATVNNFLKAITVFSNIIVIFFFLSI